MMLPCWPTASWPAAAEGGRLARIEVGLDGSLSALMPLIERVLAAEFGGEAKIDYRTHGLVLTLEAPLPEREGG